MVLKSRLPKEVHDHIRDRCDEIFSTTGNPGNEILEMNPALRLVCADPVVEGALNSIRGEGYCMHPRRHCHQNRSDTPARCNHKDSYEEDVNVHHHRSRWATMLPCRFASWELPALLPPTFCSRLQPILNSTGGKTP